MSNNKKTGALGEELALGYLRDKGYTILDFNWTYLHLELDIIAKINETLVIVEVKTRAGAFVETLDEAVSRKKQRRIIRAADAYIQQRDIDIHTRFDIITIVLFDGGKFELEHHEDAFSPIVR
jgi:putative endonuclease